MNSAAHVAAARTRLRVVTVTTCVDSAGERRSRYHDAFHHTGTTMIAQLRMTAEQVPGLRGCPGTLLPNFLTMASPFAWVGLSWFNAVEYQMRHMNRLFGEPQRRGARTFEVTGQANDRFLDRMDELLDDSVFYAGNCATSRSYWFNPSGEAPLFRPKSVRDAVAEKDRFPLSDYAIS